METSFAALTVVRKSSRWRKGLIEFENFNLFEISVADQYLYLNKRRFYIIHLEYR